MDNNSGRSDPSLKDCKVLEFLKQLLNKIILYKVKHPLYIDTCYTINRYSLDNIYDTSYSR
jgi:hypothetical protein